MGNVIFGRLILLVVGIASAILAYSFSQEEIINTGLKTAAVIASESQISSYSTLGFCLISSTSMLGFGLTYLKKDN